MFRELLRRVRAEVSGERALASLRGIAAFHRIQASPGYDAAADYVAGELAETGLEVAIERVPGDGRTRFLGQLMPEGWAVERAAAWLVAGDERRPLCEFETEPLSLVQRSAPAQGRYRLVAIEDSVEPSPDDGRDLGDAVVLTRAPARPALERAIRERGAAGLLCDGRRLFPPVRGSEHDLDSLAYTSFWWNGGEPRGWGFVVSPRVGNELRERLARGERLVLEVDIASRRFETTIPLVTARLPGAFDAETLVVSHLCHPHPGANDNASGAAAALETARAIGALARGGALGSPRRGVTLLWMPELTGTFAWLGGVPRRTERLVAALNLDMVGADQAQCGSTLLLEHPPCFAASFAEELLSRIRAESLDWITSYSGPGHYSLDRLAEVPYSGGSDHAVLVDPSIGVPCPMLIQWPDRYYHSSFDTPDRCSPGSLAVAARCAAAYAAFLAAAGPEEVRWLTELVARGARRRLLAAQDAADPERGAKRERVRGTQALRSLSRLGASTEAEVAAFEAFAAAERHGARWDARGAGVAPADVERLRPRRLKRGPLDFLDHLNPGYETLEAADRAAWRALRARCPDPFLELAWFGCDGVRTVGEIAALVELETGRWDPESIASFFALTTRMGLSAGNGKGV